MKRLTLFCTFLIFLASVNVVNSNVVTFVEENAIKLMLSNCAAKKNALGITYEKVKNQAKAKLPGLSLQLYTEGNNKICSPLCSAKQTIIDSPQFNPSWSTVIIIHGYFTDAQFPDVALLARTIKDKVCNINVLTLDHSCMTRELSYFLATENARYVGEAVAQWIVADAKIPCNKLHLIGHSLGAQIAGFIGQAYKSITGNLIFRISGVDPAGPCFNNEPCDKRLDKTDAAFVDALHCESVSMGYGAPLGHVDFYPNNGKSMPGCCEIVCSHIRCMKYYIESVQNKNAFLAVPCSSWNNFQGCSCKTNTLYPMGYWTPNTTPAGIYYLKTAENCPYGLGYNGVNNNYVPS